MDIPHYFIHSSVNRPLDYFYLLATITNAALNIRVHVFVWKYAFVSLGYIPRSEMAGSHDPTITTCLILWGDIILFFYFSNKSILFFFQNNIFQNVFFKTTTPFLHSCHMIGLLKTVLWGRLWEAMVVSFYLNHLKKVYVYICVCACVCMRMRTCAQMQRAKEQNPSWVSGWEVLLG